MRIAILTSSRADYGIYRPLLKNLKKKKIAFDIIAFGSHLSLFHGYTLNNILEDHFEVPYRLETLVMGDTMEAIATSMGLTTIKFASFWEQHQSSYDFVLCLGDRYEMFAAVSAGIPFNIRFAHLHAGEMTLGAIDNVFRHAITHASRLHFTATQKYADRVKQMVDESIGIYHVGALSLDNLKTQELLDNETFKAKWGIDLSVPTILLTFHPETVSIDNNGKYAAEIATAIKKLNGYQIVITMPNADPDGNAIRRIFTDQLNNLTNVFLVENFGTIGYFTIMQRCRMLIGNTSSGIIEAASFGKYVINLGDRQKGRITSNNIIQTEITSAAILKAVKEVESFGDYTGTNVYWKGGAANMIANILNEYQ